MQSAPPSQAPWIRQKWAFLAGLARRMPRLFHCCTKIETSGAARRPTNQFPCISYQHANEQPITVRLHALSLAPWNLALECETGSAQTRTNQALKRRAIYSFLVEVGEMFNLPDWRSIAQQAFAIAVLIYRHDTLTWVHGRHSLN